MSMEDVLSETSIVHFAFSIFSILTFATKLIRRRGEFAALVIFTPKSRCERFQTFPNDPDACQPAGDARGKLPRRRGPPGP